MSWTLRVGWNISPTVLARTFDTIGAWGERAEHYSLCQQKFRELMEMMKDKVSMPAVKELIDDVEKHIGLLDKLKDNSEIKRKVKALRKIIAS